MSIPVEIRCRDYGSDGCLEIPDEKFTKNFDDIGELPIYFCSFCGPRAEILLMLVFDALAKEGENFRKQLSHDINQIHQEQNLRDHETISTFVE